MKWVPRFYQVVAMSFMLVNKFGALFLDPGLGKTSTSLSIFRILLQDKSSKGVLIIAPLRVCSLVWPLEITKWDNFSTLSHVFLHGKNKTYDDLFNNPKDVYLLNPAGLPWLYKTLLKGLKVGKKCPFDILIVDESTDFKNPTSKTRFDLIKDMLSLFKRRYILTGTPSPNSLMDLWAQMYIVDKGESLGTNFYKFRSKYFHQSEDCEFNWVLKKGSAELIQKAISPVCLNMSVGSHLKMPPLIINDIRIKLPKAAMASYKSLENDCFTELDGGGTITADAAAQAVMKCQQIANGKVYEDIDREVLDDEEYKLALKNRKTYHIHKAKQEALRDLFNELQGKPLLIAYKFKHDLIAIREALGDIPYIGSGVNEKDTLKILNDWNAGLIPALAGQPSSMGHGLNMQASGNDVCWYSLDHSLELTLQFNARIYRQGVSGSVRIHRLVSAGTVDELILHTLKRKDNTQTKLRDAISEYRKNALDP